MKENEREKPPEEIDTTEEEWVPEDDSIIGKAFRWSLVVIAGVAVLVVI